VRQVHRLQILFKRRSLRQALIFAAKNLSFPFDLVVPLGLLLPVYALICCSDFSFSRDLFVPASIP
jgi:hypothetical protein